MSDRAAVMVAVAIALGAWSGRSVPALPWWPGMALLALGLAIRRPLLLALGGALAAVALSHAAWAGVVPPMGGPFSAVVVLVEDPQVHGAGTHAVVSTPLGRLDAWAYGEAAARLRPRLAGEVVWLEGRIPEVPAGEHGRLGAHHVRGRLQVSRVRAVNLGSPAARSANRVRRALARGAAVLPAGQRPLYLGMVIGDDRDLGAAAVDRFRASGLSHLTAVSGQNVAFLLALAAPLISRLPIRGRWVATVVLIGWFVLVTRAEPSVLRAAAMAVLAATAKMLGRPASPVRLLALAVGGLLLIDPLLVWSVGFWLSAGATAGIAVLGPPLETRVPGPRWLAGPLAISVAAQVGVLPVSVAVFGGIPAASVPANVAVGPVAGAITMLGLPAGLVAAFAPRGLGEALLLPTRACLWWVDAVARVASRAPAVPGPVVVSGALLAGTSAVLLTRRSRPAATVGSPPSAGRS